MAKQAFAWRLRRFFSELIMGLIALFCLLWSLSAAAAPVSYSYDSAGRLIQVQSSAGSGQFQYDAAGNLLSVTQNAPGVVQIVDVFPATGPAGSNVTITGTGFSATASANTITFNGSVATVVSASSTSLVVTVPAAATTGKVTVLTSAGTATSPADFVVGPASDAQPMVSAPAVSLASPGSTVTLTGQNLVGTGGSDLWVRVNGQMATVTNSSTTSLSFTVPNNATSGTIEVGTRNGETLSAGKLYVPAQGVLTSSISSTINVAIDGAATAFNLASGQTALVTFDAVEQQGIGLGISVGSGSAVSATIYQPNGALLVYCPVASGGQLGATCHLPFAPTTGTYTVVVTSQSGATNVQLTASNDLPGILKVGDTPGLLTITRPGQCARYTFNGQAGGNYSINWSGSTLSASGGTLKVFQANGTLLTSGSFGSSAVNNGAGFFDLRNLPTTGEYTVAFEPIDATASQIRLGLNALSAVTLDAPPKAVSLQAGQNGYFTFSGTAGTGVGIGVSSVTTTPPGETVSLNLIGINGQNLSCTGAIKTIGACGLLLPSTGTYTAVLTVSNGAAAELTLTQSTDIPGLLLPNAPAITFNSTRVGQRARFQFGGGAGQTMDFILTDNGTPVWVNEIHVRAPDTSTFGTGGLNGSGSQKTFSTTLAQSGTYSLFLGPNLGNSALSVQMFTFPEATGKIAIDGAPVSVAMTAQHSEFTFDGIAGQQLGLGISNLTQLSSESVLFYVNAPDGSSVGLGGSLMAYTTGASVNLPPLPSTGTYTVIVIPGQTFNATALVTLSSDLTGAIQVGGAPTTFQTSRVGQNGRYAFSASAGQNLVVSWSGDTFIGASSNLQVLAPSGLVVATANFSDTVASGSVALNNLQESGNYVVFLDPFAASTGALTFQVSSNGSTAPAAETVDGSVSVDASPAAISLSGKISRYTFTGTVGQTIGLGINSLKGLSSVNLSVLSPDNRTALAACSLAIYAPGSSCNLPPLPSTGTYTVVLNPGASSGSLQLTLSTDLSQTLTANAAPSLVTISRVGQNARYYFNATAGQPFSLSWSAANFANGANLQIVAPNGYIVNQTVVGSRSQHSGVFSLRDYYALPITGKYTVFLDPTGTDTGSVTLQLVGDAPSGVLNVDGSPSRITLATNQSVTYTFQAVAGQTVGLGINGLTTNPSGGSVTVEWKSPSERVGSYSCQLIAPADSCAPLPLGATGTYALTFTANTGSSASFIATLSNDVQGTLQPNGPSVTFSSSRVGQNGRYVFAGVQGGAYQINVSAGSNALVSVLDPDGVDMKLDQTAIDPLNAQSASLLQALIPRDGSYTVRVSRVGGSTAQVVLSLNAVLPQVNPAGDDSPANDAPVPIWALLVLGVGFASYLSRRRIR